MQSLRFLVICGLAAALAASSQREWNAATNVVQPNENTERAGVMRDGVLTVALEARESLWQLNGPNRPLVPIAAFAEIGRAALIPGPLVRAPQGTEIHIAVRNALRAPLTFFVPASLRGQPDRSAAMDSIVIPPGGSGTLRARATAAGNYIYRASTPGNAATQLGFAGLLAGAIVIDPAGVNARQDHVFVIMQTPDPASVACADTARGNIVAQCLRGRFVYTINGRSWPNTRRIAATVGDSLNWRVLNASFDVHLMHLHGFYFRVDAFSSPSADESTIPAPGQMVVTQLMTPFSTMSMRWSPDRPGNWLFHCHFALHLQPDSMSGVPDDPDMRGMAGLVLGVNVAARPGVRVAGQPTATRHLRLIAIADSASQKPGPGGDVPSMRFVLEEHGRRVDTGRDFSAELDLTRGEPVSITVINRLGEPTSVHWHGIEVEDSYVDGVPGFSGAGRRLAPAIAPGDSFVARFTPRRSGTFMYHAHVDDVREQMAGLEGTLIVREPGERPSTDDHSFFLKGDLPSLLHPLEINGQANPDTVVLHVGRPARLRLINLSTQNPAPTTWLTARPDSALASRRDTLVVRWRPVAKDGMDLPASAQAPRLARQPVGMGETYDFEYTPTHPGPLQLEIRGTTPPGRPVPGRLLIRVPIRVE